MEDTNNHRVQGGGSRAEMYSLSRGQGLGERMKLTLSGTSPLMEASSPLHFAHHFLKVADLCVGSVTGIMNKYPEQYDNNNNQDEPYLRLLVPDNWCVLGGGL